MRLSAASAALAALATIWTGAQSVAGAPVVLAGDGLTEDTWAKTNKGTWLVEHFSPYCGHCRSFAPTWKEFVDLTSSTAARHDFHFAQVDCAANGDLCHTNGVKYYPSIFLYKDGKFVEEYMEKRTMENLEKYVEEKYNLGAKLEEKEEAPKTGGTVDKEETGKGESRPKKGAEKARLPKEGDEATPLPILHVADEDAAFSSASGSAEPFAELVKEAEENGENDVLYPSLPSDVPSDTSTTVATTSTSTQTPPSTPTATVSKFVPAPFVAQQPAPMPMKREKPDGTVKVLKAEQMDSLKSNDAEPAFVKYFAPWCSHCRSLAPKWADLASTLSTSVHIYEMDCDAAENKKACRGENVRAYPTLIFYNRGASVEYLGKRNVESMKQFALKAMASTTVTPLSSSAELKDAVSAEEVVILFLHSTTTSSDEIALAHSAAKSLLGASVAFYSSSSPEVHSTFASSYEEDKPAFLTFHDHSLSPSSSFYLPSESVGSPKYRLALTRQYLRTTKLPTLSELNGATFSDLMPIQGELVGPSPPPLIGLAILSRKGLGQEDFEMAKEEFGGIAKGWGERRRMGAQGEKDEEVKKKGVREIQGERQVLWAWVDGDRWAGWARSMFDVKEGAKSGPRVVVADPKDLTYYSTSLSDAPLDMNSDAVYELIEQGIFTGKAKASSSRNTIERFGHVVVSHLSSLYTTAITHPIFTLLFIVASWFLLWKGLRKALAGGPDLGGAGAAGGYLQVGRGPKRE
ncbi:hypothetical protein JCM11641_001064 [Rhodosporidiobolus odoratus]